MKLIKCFVSLLILNMVILNVFAVKVQDPKKFTIDEVAILTTAPEVPPAIKRSKPARVKINLEVVEVTKRLADGVEYNFWTFGGTVPRPMMRIRQGDYVEFNLHNNPKNKIIPTSFIPI